ncbi:MAG: hypothetical protein WC548_04525 [Candidatus Pacearchaeota archaeon]
MKIEKILEEELASIKPSDDEIKKLNKIANNFINSIKKYKLKAQIGGSLAKGTLIKKKKKQDIDIFVIFDYSEDILNLEKILKKIKLFGKLKKIHGSRDYFQIECDDVILEIIPVVKNNDPELAENVTDVSLRHVNYVKNKIQKNPKITNEIRLSKIFCQAQKCYGAESYIKGFSGYSLEVLTIYFGGFLKFLKGISKKRIIDPEKYFQNEKEILRELNSSKIQGPVILIDPTYKFRNITAGLSEETFEKFLKSAKSFLKSPSIDLFIEKKIDLDELKNFAQKNNSRLIGLNLTTNRQEGDIAGSKMKKFFDFFARELQRKQQEVLIKEFEYNNGKTAAGYLVVKEKTEIEIRGPSLGLEEAVRNFSKSKKEIFKKGGYVWTKEKISVEKVFEQVKKLEKEMDVKVGMKNI